MLSFGPHTGSWAGTNRFRLMPTDQAAAAPATAILSTAAAGHLTVIAYTWSHPQDGPQDGVVSIGVDDEPGSVVGLWGDSWHQSPGPRVLTGTIDGPLITVGYDYAGDWRWDITLDVTRADALTITMDNVVPESAVTDGVVAGAYWAMMFDLKRIA